jgi:hypothetical protein
MIIAISGYARSGKDTIGDILVSLGFQKVAFADKLREALLELNPIITFDTISNQPIRYNEIIDLVGYERAKTIYPEIRNLLQKLSTQVGRNVLDEDIWINLLTSKLTKNNNWVITDCRFPNEAQAIKNYDGNIWQVVRPDICAANSHISEHALNGFNFDQVIINDGTIEDLADKVYSLLKYYEQ